MPTAQAVRARALARAQTRGDVRVPFLVGFLLLGLTLAVTARGQEAKRSRFPPPLVVTPESVGSGSATKGSGPTFADEVLELVNVERLNNGGLAPLKGNDALNAAAFAHSTNMAVRDFFAHCDLDTLTDPGDRVLAQSYVFNSLGENIAAGYSTPADVMAGWMLSDGHRANILGTSFRELGIGYFEQAGDLANIRRDQNGDCVVDSTGNGPYVRYWTQNFGRRASVYPAIINREAYQTMDPNVALYIYGAGVFSHMRIRNEAGTFTPWIPFATDYGWQLSHVNGIRTVEVELGNGITTQATASDTIRLSGFIVEIFADGFESGNTSAWSSTVP